MYIDIKPIKKDKYNCFEGLIITIAEWCNHNHEMMFAESWGFKYEVDSITTGEKIGSFLSPMAGDTTNFLLKYHGIKLNPHFECTPEKILEEINNNLLNNLPVIIFLDMFWCPWSKKYYQKFHVNHLCLVTGIDENESLYCIDTDPLNYGSILPKLDFFNGCSGYINISILDEALGNLDWKSILKNSVERLMTNSSFSDMKKFAKQIKEGFNLYTEIKGHEDLPSIAPLFINLNSISTGRANFGKTLSFLAEKMKIEELYDFSSLFNEYSNRWFQIRSFFVKAIFIKNNESILEKISDKINKLANDEENTATKLLELCLNEGYYKKSLINFRPESNELELQAFKNRRIQYLDLSEYFNNNGFGDICGNISNSNLDGWGRFFITDKNTPTNTFLEINSISFKFPTINHYTNNNICCSGQIIDFEPISNVNSILIFACSTVNDLEDTIQICFTNGIKESIITKIPSWENIPASSEPQFWRGRYARKTKDTVEVGDDYRYIYAKSYELKNIGEIHSIQLPICPTINIFAISLSI